MNKTKQFTVIGLGYVGLSLATLLSTKYKVKAIDIDKTKISSINQRISPIKDKFIERFFDEKDLSLYATLANPEAVAESDYVIIATPTDYNEKTNEFDTESVEEMIDFVQKYNKKADIIIKSTIPVGFIDGVQMKYNTNRIYFSPEFLREGNALYDNLYPSRIIVGSSTPKAEEFANILKDLSLNNPEIILMDSLEAEAVKLFSNTYLAMRIGFFNELDTFAETKNLNSEAIIKGMSLDPRIGNYYNNPSFGYGGYCLPKDTKQLLATFSEIPNSLVKAIVESNEIRKQHIANQVLAMGLNTVGVYGLAMKKGSDNFRSAAIFDVIELLVDRGINIYIYEPQIQEQEYSGLKVIDNFDEFIEISELILANRMSEELMPVKEKVYTRDIFNEN